MRWGNRGANDETFDWPVALTLPLPAGEDIAGRDRRRRIELSGFGL